LKDEWAISLISDDTTNPQEEEDNDKWQLTRVAQCKFKCCFVECNHCVSSTPVAEVEATNLAIFSLTP
jgi:hypothetical protein